MLKKNWKVKKIFRKKGASQLVVANRATFGMDASRESMADW